MEIARVTISSKISQVSYVQHIYDPMQFSQQQANLRTHLLDNIICNFKIRLCLYKIVMNNLLSPFFYISFFFYWFCFSNIIMYNLNIASTVKKISVNKLRNFVFENCYKQIAFIKERSYYSMKPLTKSCCSLQTN